MMQWIHVLTLCALVSNASQSKIEQYLDDLGSDDYAIRERATRELRRYPEAEGHLLVARQGDDLEVRQRADKILPVLYRLRYERVIRSRTQAIVAGRVDLVPDLLEFTHPHDRGEQITGALAILTSDAVLRGKAQRGDFRQIRSEEPALWTYERPLPNPLEANRPVRGRHYFLADEVSVDIKLWPEGVMHAQLCGRFVNVPLVVRDSLLVAREEVRPERSSAAVKGCVIVSGGNIRYCNQVDSSIVFADGIIRLEEKSVGCLLIARSGLDVPELGYRRCKIQPGEGLILDKQSLGIVASPTKRPLGLIRFFEVADVGLTLDACKVTKVTGPLAKAGVQSGDVFTHVDGVAVKDAEVIRKALRRRYAILGYGAFTLSREGKSLTIVAELGE